MNTLLAYAWVTKLTCHYHKYSAEYYANGEVRMFQGIRMLLQIYAQGYQLARGLKEPSTKP